MSLINDMLRDLEKRQAPDRTQQAPAQQYGALTQREAPRSNRLVMALLALTVVTFIGLVLGWWYLQTYQTSSTETDVIYGGQAEKQQTHSPSPESLSRAETESSAMAADRVAMTKPVLTKPDFNKAPDKVNRVTEPRVAPTPVVSLVEQESGIQPSSVNVAEESYTPNKPTNKTKKESDKKAVAVASASKGESSVSHAPRSSTAAKKNVSEKTSEARLQKPSQNNTALTSPRRESTAPLARNVATPAITKTKILSPEQQDQNMADLGLGMLKRGDTQNGRDALYDFIRTHKVSEQSRIVLIRNLMQSGELTRAGDLLASSNVRANAYLRRLKGHWLAQNGQPDQAIVLLNSDLPEVYEDPEYHVLLAALYQQQGYNKEAVAKYAELLGFDQDIADWWVGMGISLDRNGQYEAAKRAYEQALNMSGLRAELAEFAKQRVSTLGG